MLQVITKPRKKLTISSIFMEIDKNLHATVLALLGIEQGSIENISYESGKLMTKTKSEIKELEGQGFVGKIIIDNDVLYYLSM